MSTLIDVPTIVEVVEGEGIQSDLLKIDKFDPVSQLAQSKVLELLEIKTRATFCDRHNLLRCYSLDYRAHYRHQVEVGRKSKYTPFQVWCLGKLNQIYQSKLIKVSGKYRRVTDDLIVEFLQKSGKLVFTEEQYYATQAISDKFKQIDSRC